MARIRDEVGGYIDPVSGALAGTYIADEEDNGFISIECRGTFDSSATEPEEWIGSVFWSTHSFEVRDDGVLTCVDDVYDMILAIKDRFDDFDIIKIYW